MAELVYPPVVVLAKTLFRALDLRITVRGGEHVPASGPAVLACNHISYLDFIFCGFGAHPARRLVRFMAKQEIFAHRIGGPLMRGMHHIPVDRDAGRDSYLTALAALRDGQVVGVFPEATISPSFTVKRIKNGAVWLAAESGAPLIPMALWGTQRLWTKGRKRTLTRRHLPVCITVGEPLRLGPADDPDRATVDLRQRMQGLLDSAQADYPDTPAGPDDSWWLPAHLGGTAPLPEDNRATPA